MKFLYSFVLLFCALNAHSQLLSEDALLLEVRKMIISDRTININQLDSSQQQKILAYLSTYSTDSLLYQNNRSLFRFVSNAFFESCHEGVRQKAAALLLDIYRINPASDGNGFWHKEAKQIDFDSCTRKRIMDILNAVPFTHKEKELLYKNELYTSLKFYDNDTLFIKNYSKKSRLSIKELRDSIATAEAIRNVNELKPKQYVLPGIIMLAAWLDMKEAIPVIETQLSEEKQEDIKSMYKLALARLGNTKYELEILSRKNIAYDLQTIGFLATRNAIDKIIEELRNDKSNYEIEILAGNHVVTIPYAYEFLIFQNDVKFLLDFPYKFENLTLDNDKWEKERVEVIKWLEQNRDGIILNRNYH